MANEKNNSKNIDNDNTEVVISGIRKSRTLLGKVSDITSMFMKKKSTANEPPPLNSLNTKPKSTSSKTTTNSLQELPTRIAHPLDRPNQMEKMEF